MTDACHLFGGYDTGHRYWRDSFVRWHFPRFRGVQFEHRMARSEQFGHDFPSFDHEETGFVAMFFIMQRAQPVDLCLGQHGRSTHNGTGKGKTTPRRFFFAMDRWP